MNHQVSSEGHSTCANLINAACAHLFTGEVQEIIEPHTPYDDATPFDAQAIAAKSSKTDLPAHHPVTVDGHFSIDSQANHAATNLSTSAGRFAHANLQTFACAHPSTGEGHFVHETKNAFADSDHHDDDGQHLIDPHALNSEVVTLHHRNAEDIQRARRLYKCRNDIIRAHGNLTRQVTSICYHDAGYSTFLPEKERAAKMKQGTAMMKSLKSGAQEAEHLFMSAGFLLDVIERAGFERQKRAIEKMMEKDAARFGMGEFISETRGFSSTQLANIIGEAGDLANYATVSRLWKRMGMAVIDGVRQSKQTDKSKALDYGYNPSRRAAMWNIGETIIKAQIRNNKDEDGKKVGESYAIGYLGQVYLDRKADYAARHPEKTKAHIHNDSKRYMEKRLLKLLWLAWNQ
jgi:hypothetical protein